MTAVITYPDHAYDVQGTLDADQMLLTAVFPEDAPAFDPDASPHVHVQTDDGTTYAYSALATQITLTPHGLTCTYVATGDVEVSEPNNA